VAGCTFTYRTKVSDIDISTVREDKLVGSNV
jgi:hypothetical protein